MRVRITTAVWILFGLATLLSLRLIVLMVFPGIAAPDAKLHSVRLRADMEHLRLLRVDDGRGRILFRNGLPWSGGIYSVVFDRDGFYRNEQDKTLPHSSQPAHTWVHDEKTHVQVSPVVGSIGLPDKWPSSTRFVQEQGRSGLEYTFDRWLRQGHPGYVGWLHAQPESDVWQHKLFWLQPTPGIDLRTTVDAAWQRTAQDALRRHGVVDGAVVVLDVKTRNILAMASQSRDHRHINEAVRAKIPGSVFKVVTATAAWDSYQRSPYDRFYCNGLLHQPGIKLHCWRKHGTETLLQAFAGSCNVAFATMGLEQGPHALNVAAQRLGLFSTGLQTLNGRPVLPEAERGRVFLQRQPVHRHSQQPSIGTVAHAAIGQQDVRISPLQGANLAATVAAGGLYRNARLVLDAERQGHSRQVFANQRDRRAISPATAGWIAMAMHMAAHDRNGTAFDLASLAADAAVKTGTAQVPSSAAGRAVVNSWIVGFAPYHHPKIAFAVYVGQEKESAGHRQVHAITKDLLNAYMQFRPDTVIG